MNVNEINVLVSTTLIELGIDIKTARIAILMASSTNPREYVQRIGRVIRPSKNKEISEILVAGDDAYKLAKDFFKILSPHNLKKIKNAFGSLEYTDEDKDIWNWLYHDAELMDIESADNEIINQFRISSFIFIKKNVIKRRKFLFDTIIYLRKIRNTISRIYGNFKQASKKQINSNVISKDCL